MEMRLPELRRLRRAMRVTLPEFACILVAMQYLDVLSTWIVLRVGGHEVFPPSAIMLSLGGFAALLVFKSFCALLSVLAVVLAEVGWPEKPGIAANIALAGILWLLVVIFWNLFQAWPVLSHLAHLG